ncbi:MAG: helix-turn-helix transcriptional regulator [Henriciella sp.]|uniref:helix-turn-helix transcriptional regulator n=1 Tax=Henriciella sp. TaxID=1968823 RepID=UPI003C75B46C
MKDIERHFLDGIFDPAAQQAALRHIADECDARAAHLMVADGARNLLQSTFTCEVDPDFAQLEHDFQPINPRVAAIPFMKAGKASRDKDYITREEIARDQTYQELILPMGFGHMSAVPLLNNARGTAGIALHRSMEEDEFSDETAERQEQLVRAALPALDLAAKLEHMQARTLLAKLADHVIAFVTSRAGWILEASDSADLLFSMRILRRLPDGRFAFCNRPDQIAYERLTGASQPASGRFVCRGRAPAHTWLCTVYPVPCFGAIEVSGPILVTFERAGGARALDKKLAAAVFGLTRAEADIASELMAGQSLADIATARGIAISTARTHLARLFSKTGTTRQPELVLALSDLLERRPG